jgi:hypothetical protein
MKNNLMTVSWRKYLDESVNPKVKKFLLKHGHYILKEISLNVSTASDQGKEQIALLLHHNASSVAVIKKRDYEEVLATCLHWLEDHELYEQCSDIQSHILNVRNNKLKQRKEVVKPLEIELD